MPDIERLETKYTIDSLEAVELADYLHHFVSFQKRAEELVSNNRSVYLDDSNLSLYRLSLQPDQTHVKLRLRDYGRKGSYERDTWVELKEKRAGHSSKSRFRLSKRLVGSFLEGRLKEQRALHNGNSRDQEQHKAFQAVRSFMQQSDYRPLLVTEYDRICFDTVLETRIRITLDRNLKFYFVNGPFSYHSFARRRAACLAGVYSDCILETKIDNPELTPRWLQLALQRFGLQQAAFSKYTAGMDTILQRLLVSV